MIADLLQTLLPDRSTYNELAPDGVPPRPHWSSFIESLQAMGADELAHRWEHAERRIRENGVTYNIYTDPQGANRPLAIGSDPAAYSAGRVAFHRGGHHSEGSVAQSAPRRYLWRLPHDPGPAS